MCMFSRKTLPKLVGKELSLCFNIPASKKDSINSLGKLTTSLPDILRNLLPPHTHTNTLHTHAFYKTLSVRELFWETSLRPQANTGSPLYTKFQGPSLTGLLTQSLSLLFLDYTFGCLMGMEGDRYPKKEKREDNAQV